MRAFYCAWPEEEIFQTPSGKLVDSEIAQAASAGTREVHVFTDALNVSTNFMMLAARFALPRSAYVRLLSVKTKEARGFYEAEALREGWSVRQLDRQISSQLFERCALSRNKAALLQNAERCGTGDALTPEEAIRDPFVLEFLDLKDEYSETDLEGALRAG
ncbi:DUF1016 domain-containing protein YhcG (fragment) [Pararobbsia alpina]